MTMVKCMNSRMDKYYKEKEQNKTSRTSRHKGIYKDVSDENYEKLNLTSNISIIETDEALDIGRIKEIVTSKYDKPKNRRTDIEDLSVEDLDDEYEEDTKEYDLKKVIETAHKNKTPNYDRERFEHIRETQYDILNSLNIIDQKDEKGEEPLSEEEATLINLIKTVNENAEKNHSPKPEDSSDDLLGDLMGGQDTEVLKPISFDEDEEPDKKPTILEEIEKTKQLSKQEIEGALAQEAEKESGVVEDDESNNTEKQPLSKTEELSNSFYTGKYSINDKDLDDFVDLEKEMKGGSLVVKILIVIIVIITIAVAIYLLNKYLNLGLF